MDIYVYMYICIYIYVYIYITYHITYHIYVGHSGQLSILNRKTLARSEYHICIGKFRYTPMITSIQELSSKR